MDAANFGRVVVDQPDDALLTVAFNADFFVEFPLHARAVPIVTGGVLDGNMTADSDGPMCMQSFFALSFSSGVLEELRSSCVAAFEDDVGDQLFEGGIGFNQTSGTKRLIFAVKYGRKVTVDIGLEPRKRSELIKQLCRNYKNFFVSGHVERRFLLDFVDFGELPPGKQGSLDLSLSDTIHGLAIADHSLFRPIQNSNSLLQQLIHPKHERTPLFIRSPCWILEPIGGCARSSDADWNTRLGARKAIAGKQAFPG